MPRCIIINQPLANSSHGTGKQLQYFVQLSALSSVHVSWDSQSPKGDEPCEHLNLYYDHSHVFDRWHLPFGRRLLFQIQNALPVKWWDKLKLSTISRWRLRLLARRSSVAYVIVSSEDTAQVALACLTELRLPYVLNWLDLETSELLTPEQHPCIAAINAGAEEVFAITPTLAAAIGRFTRKPPRLLLPGRPPAQRAAQAPAVGQPLRCVMIGSLSYSSLTEQWPAVIQAVRASGVELDLFYIGSETMYRRCPPELEMTYLGSLTDEARDAALATMHLGFLPGPDGDPNYEHLSRYSFPSRVADYFCHGLPVIGTVHPESSAAQALQLVLGESAWLSQRPRDLVAAITGLARNSESWKAAAQGATAFAAKNFDVVRMVRELTEALSIAGGRGKRPPV